MDTPIMHDLLFLFGLVFLLANLLIWGFRHLPGERWQMLAVLPNRKGGPNLWQGTNLTYYGFFIATSQMISLALLVVLLGSLEISIFAAAPAILTVLAFAVPAARIIARLVEKKRHTFTVGGASFTGIILAPWVILFWDRLLGSYQQSLPMIPLLASMAIAYTLGEGLGRLGCISFGCCYGKPISECGPIIQKLFGRLCFIFSGENKKVSYESQLAGQRLVPIQAITCVVYTLTALIASLLFLQGFYTAALLLSMAITQLWRIVSEMWRADFRGFGKMSAYQKMGMVGLLYLTLVVLLLPADFAGLAQLSAAHITSGLRALWNPAVILGIQLLWLVFFLFFGKSTVIASTVSFNLIRERI